MKLLIPIVLIIAIVGAVIVMAPNIIKTEVVTLENEDDALQKGRSLEAELEHIEDQNGAEDMSLHTITDEHILSGDYGALDLKIEQDVLSKGIIFSSSGFSGVYEIFSNNYTEPTSLEFEIAGFFVHSGNFKMAVVNNGEIISLIHPESFVNVKLGELEGEVSLVIAGESADFLISIDPEYCEELEIKHE